MVEEVLLELVDAADRTVLAEWVILIGIEYYNIAETQFLLLVAAYQFIIYRIDREACAQCHHIILAFVLGSLNALLNAVGNMTTAFAYRCEDIGMNFLHAGDFGVFHGRLRLVEFHRYLVEYDL